MSEIWGNMASHVARWSCDNESAENRWHLNIIAHKSSILQACFNLWGEWRRDLMVGSCCRSFPIKGRLLRFRHVKLAKTEIRNLHKEPLWCGNARAMKDDEKVETDGDDGRAPEFQIWEIPVVHGLMTAWHLILSDLDSDVRHISWFLVWFGLISSF